MSVRKLYLYTHTHWDREWYQPFESFRAQLVDVVRKALSQLEDGSLKKFYLDGQAIIFEDILEIEPELMPRLQQAMASGELAAGPWYVLNDQLLVGGESMVRNLKIGLEVTRRFGQPSMIGYCPDTFGHSQDLPRILQGFGIKFAVVWRGVPELQMGPVFWWHSPDGSKVLAYHFTHGYYQTAFHEADTRSDGNGKAVEKLGASLLPWVGLDGSKTANHLSSYYRLIDGALFPVGADHVGPPANLSKTVNELNNYFQQKKIQLELQPVMLSQFLDQVETSIASGINVVQGIFGELRDNSVAPFYERSYLLDGVLSTRLYLKRMNRLTEYELTRLCEPMFAILHAKKLMDYPLAELKHAWKLLLKNHPHDSICGCSVDEVHQEMVVRSAQINDITRILKSKADESITSTPPGISAGDPGVVKNKLLVVNTSSSEISAPVWHEWFVEANDNQALPKGTVQVENEQTLEQLFSGWGNVPYYKRVKKLGGYIWAHKVPAVGMARHDWPLSHEKDALPPKVEVKRRRIFNGLVDVTVESNGDLTCKVDGLVYQLGHHLIDVGDGGDSYNFDPIPGDKPITAKLVAVNKGKGGPLVGSLVLTYEIDIPERAEFVGYYTSDTSNELSKLHVLKRSKKKLRHLIETELVLKRGSALVYFETSWNNQSSDHRLEVQFNCNRTLDVSYAENHFSLVPRKHNMKMRKETLPVPAGHEAAPSRFPQQRFFVAAGQLFLNQGLTEYAIEKRTASITLLRATSWLSRQRLWTRGGGAGPIVEVPGCNCLGPNRTSYAWAPLPPAPKKSGFDILSDEMIVESYRLAENYEGHLWSTLTDAKQTGSASFISSDNPTVRLVSMRVADDGQKVIARFLNVSSNPQRVHFSVSSKAKMNLCRLDEEVLEPVAINSQGKSANVIFEINELKTVEVT